MSLLIKENSNKRKTRQPWIKEVKNYLVISEKVCMKNSPAFDNLKLKPNCTTSPGLQKNLRWRDLQ